MRLYLINPFNPPVSLAKVKESRWNRYRIWKPLSLMALAALTPPEWEIMIVDENLSVPDCIGMHAAGRAGRWLADTDPLAPHALVAQAPPGHADCYGGRPSQ